MNSHIKNMKYPPFVINFQFVVYEYDLKTKGYKDPVARLFQHEITSSNGQEIVKDLTLRLMRSMPDILSGYLNSSEKYTVHRFFPPVVSPLNPATVNVAAMKVADVVKYCKVPNPPSNSMTITVLIMERYEGFKREKTEVKTKWSEFINYNFYLHYLVAFIYFVLSVISFSVE